MILTKEQLFRSVFNCATLPMIIVEVKDLDFDIIAQNKFHKDIAKQSLEGVSMHQAMEKVFGENEEDLAMLLNSLKLAKTNRQAIQIPVMKFPDYVYPGSEDLSGQFHIEIVPVGDAEVFMHFMLIWHPINQNDPIQHLDQVVPVMETPLGEQLAETNERIELGNEELEAANEELEAVTDELVQTQEDLDALNRKLENMGERENGSGHWSEIEQQRDRLRRFLMQAPAGICVLDGPDFILELVNPSFQQLFPERKLLGKTVLEGFPEIREQQIWAILREVFQTGKHFQGNEWLIPLVNAEGVLEDRYFNFIYQARFDAAGKTDGLLVFVYEVTDMVQIRLEVEENEKRFRLLLNAIPQIAWTNTVDGRVNFYNEQWYAYTGIDFNEELNLDLEQVIHPEDLQYHQDQFHAILACEESGNYEIRNKGANGEYRWYLIHMQPIKDEAGQVLLWIGTATDIHELKLLQQKKDDLITIASHELKTPVASLKASMQLLDRMKHNASEKMQNLIDVAGRSADKVSGLITDLLDPGQLNDGGVPLKKTALNLFSLVEDCCQSSLKPESVRFEISGDETIQVDADAIRVEQVITNIVNNAIKYAPESKTIRIHVERLNDMAKLSVSDEGGGIPEDKIAYLFNRYYRADKHKASGLGLGLYISADIVNRHHGKIGVESKVGKGCTFWFTLPLFRSKKAASV